MRENEARSPNIKQQFSSLFASLSKMSPLNQLSPLLQLLITAITVIPSVSTLPSGAPPASCLSLSPQHGFVRSLPVHSSPFSVETVVKREGSRNGDRTGEAGSGKVFVQVDIVPKSGFPTFRGFVAQARLASNPGIIVDASWLPQEPRLSRTFVCGGANRQQNTWTHSSPLPKHRISALLVPPPGFSGQIVIQATVVATRDTFWEGVLSGRVNLVIHSPTNAVIIEQPAINELLDAVSYNVMDMEPDVDSDFYGIGDPDEPPVLYLSPKEQTEEKGAKKLKEDEDDGDDQKDGQKTDKELPGQAKQCKVKSKIVLTKKTKEKENGLQPANEGVEEKEEEEKECSMASDEPPLKKTLSEDDLVLEPGDLEKEENWEEAFNFEE